MFRTLILELARFAPDFHPFSPPLLARVELAGAHGISSYAGLLCWKEIFVAATAVSVLWGAGIQKNWGITLLSLPSLLPTSTLA